MLKTLIISISALLLLSTQASAQQESRLDDRLIRKANRLATAIDRNLDAMTRPEKKQTLKLINQAIKVVRGQGNGTPGGGVIIRFKLETDNFIIDSGGSIPNVKSACLTAIKSSNLRNIDDVSAEVSGVKKSLHTSGWWTSDEQKCQAVTATVLKAAASAGVKIAHSRYVLTGHADGQPVLAEGDSLSSLKSSCERLTKISGNVDDIAVSLNGGPTKKTHNNGWWKTTREVCQNAIAIVF